MNWILSLAGDLIQIKRSASNFACAPFPPPDIMDGLVRKSNGALSPGGGALRQGVVARTALRKDFKLGRAFSHHPGAAVGSDIPA